MIERIVCLIIGYMAGSIIQAGFWIGKFNHIDIRDYGSGNAGTTNTMRTLGKKAGIATYLADMLKAVLVTLIIHFMYGSRTDIAEMLLVLYGGLGVVLGHNFPFYLKFRGGKGIAASSGVVMSMMLYPQYCFVFTILGITAFALVAKISRYVSLASLTAIGLFFLEFLLWGVIGWLPLAGEQLIEGIIVAFVFTLLAFIKHSGNIKRLLSGTERKIGEKK